MSYKVDFIDNTAIEWQITDDGVDTVRNPDYTPSIYVSARGSSGKLDWLEDLMQTDPKMVDTSREQWYTELGADLRTEVLRIDAERPGEVDTLAREIRTLHEFQNHAPGTFTLYNVDFSPQFRYCLENDLDPTPRHRLTTLQLDLTDKAIVDGDLGELQVEGKRIDATAESEILERLHQRIQLVDPDVFILSTAQIVPFLFKKADDHDFEAFQLGRLDGYQQLAGESEMQTYGEILHSPARYNIPGRALIDKSNSFMWSKSGLPGILDLVERSYKPIQEAGWASIGNLLTAIQIREALDQDVLIPWNKFQHEYFKTPETLHKADRGGFIFDPDVGFYEDVYEFDFSSLYPNIMIEHNISPETVLCRCHSQREDVPELGYNICPDPGFIPQVLQPIVTDRDRLKTQIQECEDEDELERLESRSDALKWILVTCFGYQGDKNSKFGRIEAHEAINAVARDILLTAKEIFEQHGWRVIHGIVDSIWVERAAENPAPVNEVAQEITAAADIRLEFEHRFDWVCFVPKKDSQAGALTKYFGKISGENEYKVRGIEIRQRSTPAFIEAAQRSMMDALDRHREPEAVLQRCQRWLSKLQSGDVDPAALLVDKCVSKPIEAYTQSTQTVAALQRYQEHGLEKRPGQHVRYVVVNDTARQNPERVRVEFEDADEYDTDWYAGELVSACESVVSPLGWTTVEIERYLRDTVDVGLAAFD